MKVKILAVILGTILLSGCMNSNVMECTSTSKEEGYQLASKSTATFDGDKVVTIRHFATFTYDKDSTSMLDLTYSMLDSMFEAYNKYDGITYMGEKKDNQARFEIKIDVDKASSSVTELEDNGVIDIKSIPTTRSEFKDSMTAKGMTCK